MAGSCSFWKGRFGGGNKLLRGIGEADMLPWVVGTKIEGMIAAAG